MWQIIYYLALAYSVYTAVKSAPKGQPGQKPVGIDEYKVPTAEEGRAVNRAWGSPLIKGANVIGYGGFRTKAIKSKGGKK